MMMTMMMIDDDDDDTVTLSVWRGSTAGRYIIDAVPGIRDRCCGSARIYQFFHLRLLVEHLSPSNRSTRRLQSQLSRYASLAHIWLIL